MKNTLLYLFCLSSLFLIGHSPSSSLKGQINIKYLEHLVKVGVDEVRGTKNLKPLVNDSTLYIAAQFHSRYLLSIKKLSHAERNDTMTTPQMRADYFGAINYGVGENILYIPFDGKMKSKKGKIYNINTYQDAAEAMVRGWVNSKGHYKNIITSNYEITGLAIIVDYEKKRMYAVQKFAEVYFKYDFEENKSMFAFSNYVAPPAISSHDDITWEEYKEKYPYKIKPLDKTDDDYLPAMAALNKSVGFQRLKVVKSNVFLEMDVNADGLLNFLSKNKDGLAIEYINYIPFDCGNDDYYNLPSRRNNKSQLSDTLLIPVYRKSLIKGFKPRRKSAMTRMKKEMKSKKENDDRGVFQKMIDGYNMPYYPDKFKYRIAKLPKNVAGGYYEMNLVYIKNRQIYRVQHFTGICGEFYQEFNELDYVSAFGEVEYVPVPRERNLNFDFHFKRGVSTYSYADLKPVLDSLTEDAFIVLSAEIDAFSSVEGSARINKEIQHKRAQSIIQAFESKQAAKIKPTINTYTSWDLFKNQITENDELASLRGLDSLGLVEKLKDKKFTSSIEPFLKKQRIANVKIKTLFDLNDKTLPNFIKREYVYHQKRMREKKENYDTYKVNNKRDSMQRERMKVSIMKELDTLKSIQLFVFNKIKSGQFKPSFIHELDYQSVDWTTDVFLNHFYMEEYFKVADNKRSFIIDKFEKYTQNGDFYPKGAYNYLRYLVKKWDGKKALPTLKTEEVQNLLENIGYQHPELKGDLQKLKINFWFKAAEYHFIEKETNLKNEYLTRIFLYYRDRELTEDHALKLAKFFVHFEYYQPAYVILNKFLPTTKNEDIITYIFKLNNYNNIENNNDEFAEACIKIREKISKQSWCDMFVGPCNISFQVFDHEGLRNFYCAECSELKNKIQKILTED